MKSKFNSLIQEVLKEEEQNFSYYTGKEQDIIFINDLEGNIGRLRNAIQHGQSFKTVHLALKEDAVNYGYPSVDSVRYYVFYSPEDFTNPALIPI
jgi:hypothetical protein